MIQNLNPFEALLSKREGEESPPQFRWGVVAQTAPLGVVLDQDPTESVTFCASIAPSLTVGRRVLVVITGLNAIVLGGAA